MRAVIAWLGCPEIGREAVSGAHLSLENSTACQKSVPTDPAARRLVRWAVRFDLAMTDEQHINVSLLNARRYKIHALHQQAWLC